MSAIQEHIKRTAVLETCSRHGIPHDSKLAEQLQNEAEIDGSTTVYVRAASGVSLDARIEELSKNAKFASSLPSAKPVVPATDMAAMTQNFDAIAAGKVTVK